MINAHRVFGADSHFMEPPDFWERYIDPEYRDRAPKVAEDGRGLIIDGPAHPDHSTQAPGVAP